MNFIPTDEQWAKMKKHIKSDKFKKEDFFVFETLAVGDKIVPNRYIKLMPDLLLTMKEDAEQGVSLMLNHNWSQEGVQSIPIGKVFDARIGEGTQDGETMTLYTTQYILRDDSKVDGYSKNDIIKLIETGILADTSIGWGTDTESYKCSICGNCIYDYRKCEHIPGRKYIVNEETNEVKECIIEAHSPQHKHSGNNVLMENSIVFDGAYPNAIIQSKFDSNNDNNGKMLKILDSKQDLNERSLIIGYTSNGNINLLYKELQEKGGIETMQVPDEGENQETQVQETQCAETQENEQTETVDEVTDENVEVTNQETVEEADETENPEAENPEVSEQSTKETMYNENSILEKFGNIANNIDELVQLAQEGLENRNEVISQALENGVHSMGNAFNKEVFAKTFSNMKTKEIKEISETWQKQADMQFSKERISKDVLTNKVEDIENVNYSKLKTGNY